MTSPAEHAATVRDTLIEWGTHLNQYKRREDSLAALDALQAQAEANPFKSNEEKKLRKAAEAERDRLAARIEELRETDDVWAITVERLAARVTELEAALRKIADNDHERGEHDAIARAALDKEKT